MIRRSFNRISTYVQRVTSFSSQVIKSELDESLHRQSQAPFPSVGRAGIPARLQSSARAMVEQRLEAMRQAGICGAVV